MAQTTLLGVPMFSLHLRFWVPPVRALWLRVSFLRIRHVKLENKQLNVVITNLLYSCVCRELKHLILKSKEISEDAHLIWEFLFEIVYTKWDEVESDWRAESLVLRAQWGIARGIFLPIEDGIKSLLELLFAQSFRR
jgi:hypothetical protein